MPHEVGKISDSTWKTAQYNLRQGHYRTFSIVRITSCRMDWTMGVGGCYPALLGRAFTSSSHRCCSGVCCRSLELGSHFPPLTLKQPPPKIFSTLTTTTTSLTLNTRSLNSNIRNGPTQACDQRNRQKIKEVGRYPTERQQGCQEKRRCSHQATCARLPQVQKWNAQCDAQGR